MMEEPKGFWDLDKNNIGCWVDSDKNIEGYLVEAYNKYRQSNENSRLLRKVGKEVYGNNYNYRKSLAGLIGVEVDLFDSVIKRAAKGQLFDSEGNKIKALTRKTYDKEHLYEDIKKNEFSTSQLAEKYGISNTTVRRWQKDMKGLIYVPEPVKPEKTIEERASSVVSEPIDLNPNEINRLNNNGILEERSNTHSYLPKKKSSLLKNTFYGTVAAGFLLLAGLSIGKGDGYHNKQEIKPKPSMEEIVKLENQKTEYNLEVADTATQALEEKDPIVKRNLDDTQYETNTQERNEIIPGKNKSIDDTIVNAALNMVNKEDLIDNYKKEETITHISITNVEEEKAPTYPMKIDEIKTPDKNIVEEIKRYAELNNLPLPENKSIFGDTFFELGISKDNGFQGSLEQHLNFYSEMGRGFLILDARNTYEDGINAGEFGGVYMTEMFSLDRVLTAALKARWDDGNYGLGVKLSFDTPTWGLGGGIINYSHDQDIESAAKTLKASDVNEEKIKIGRDDNFDFFNTRTTTNSLFRVDETWSVGPDIRFIEASYNGLKSKIIRAGIADLDFGGQRDNMLYLMVASVGTDKVLSLDVSYFQGRGKFEEDTRVGITYKQKIGSGSSGDKKTLIDKLRKVVNPIFPSFSLEKKYTTERDVLETKTDEKTTKVRRKKTEEDTSYRGEIGEGDNGGKIPKEKDPNGKGGPGADGKPK